MAEIAKTDLIVRDEATGVDRQVLAGQPVRPELLDAYRAAGGETETGANEVRPARYTDGRGDEHELPIATETAVVKDAIGVDRQIVAGTPVPPELLEAYQAQQAPDPEPEAKTRRARGTKTEGS